MKDHLVFPEDIPPNTIRFCRIFHPKSEPIPCYIFPARSDVISRFASEDTYEALTRQAKLWNGSGFEVQYVHGEWAFGKGQVIYSGSAFGWVRVEYLKPHPETP